MTRLYVLERGDTLRRFASSARGDSARCLFAGAVIVLQGCVPIYIDQERFHAPNIVRGHPPDISRLAGSNRQLLTGKLPTRVGLGSAGEIPNPGRLYDPAVELNRNPAPGRESADDARVRFEEEWAFNRSGDAKSPPRWCVAMSGGGIRSASFNIGVLSALHHRRMLDRVDILSAVSGGAYALSWYYAQHFNDFHAHEDARRKAERGAFEKELFELGGASQDYVATHATVFNPAAYYAIGALNLAASPLNFLANGVFGWHLNTTPGRAIYEDRLRSIFLGDPREPSAPPDLSFAGVRDVVAARKLPYFIINTTAFIEHTSENLGAALYNSIYEFTPLFFGADSLGRFRYSTNPHERFFPLSLARAVAISGAALDGTKLIAGSSQRTLWSLLNQDLGYYMNNPALRQDASNAHRWLPFPLYYFHHYPRHLDGTDVYLSDGGHSENLGAYALVRRLCGNIIVVDAEHDPGYEFEAYYVLKRALRHDMNVDLRVEAIEKIAEDERSLRQLRIDATIRAEGEPDRRSYNEPYRKKLGLPDLRTVDILSSERWNSVAREPVMYGEICCLPYPDRSPNLSVAYIKLAYRADEAACDAADRLFECCGKEGATDDACWKKLEHQGALTEDDRLRPCVVKAHQDGLTRARSDGTTFEPDYKRIYFCRKRDSAELRLSRFTRLSHFPQEPTTDQAFDQWQFKAYRQLGFEVTRDRLCDPAAGAGPACCGADAQSPR